MPMFAVVPLDKIQPHPNNIRRNATADDELVESVRASGIHEPLLLGPEDADGVRPIIAGNCRYDAASKAGLTAVPALLRDDLVTLAQQIEVMLQENLLRRDLTPIEEADAYEQLTLEGIDVDAIAAATGRAKATVKSRLKLVHLPEKARIAVHEGQATISDAEALLEFDDDHEAQTQLQASLGTNDFRWRLQNLRDRRKRIDRNTQVLKDLVNQGAVESDPADVWSLRQFTTDELRDPAGHDGCLAVAHYGLDSHGEPYPACNNPNSHNSSDETDAARQAEEEARQQRWETAKQERAALDEARRAASKVRVDFMAGLFEGLLTNNKKTANDLAAATRAFLPFNLNNTMLEELVDSTVLDHALGLDTDTTTGPAWQLQQKARTELAANLATTTSNRDILVALAGFLAALTETALTATAERGVYDDADVERAIAAVAWDWLAGTDYDLSTADEQVRHLALLEPDDGEDE